jgi:hypothetical protein
MIGMPDALSHAENADHGLICYAEGNDGYRWRKPDLRLAGQKIWPGNNALSLPGFVMGVVPALPATGAKYLGCFVLMAPEDEFPYHPDVRFNRIGTYLLASDDGLRWRNVMDGSVLSHGLPIPHMPRAFGGSLAIDQKIHGNFIVRFDSAKDAEEVLGDTKQIASFLDDSFTIDHDGADLKMQFTVSPETARKRLRSLGTDW